MAPETDYATCITTPGFEQHHGSSISVPPTTDYRTYFTAGLQQHQGSIEQHHSSSISMAPTTDHTPYITTALQQHDGSNISLAQIRDSIPTTPRLEQYHFSNMAQATTAVASIIEWFPRLLLVAFTLLITYLLKPFHLNQNWDELELELIEQEDSAEEAEENLN